MENQAKKKDNQKTELEKQIEEVDIPMTEFKENYIITRKLKNADKFFYVRVCLVDENEIVQDSRNYSFPGYCEQLDMIRFLQKTEMLSPLADYRFLNWPKSKYLMLTELYAAALREKEKEEKGREEKEKAVEEAGGKAEKKAEEKETLLTLEVQEGELDFSME